MPVGEGRATGAPLADPSRLQTAQERRDLLAQGQKDMLVPPPTPKPENGPSILNTGREIVYRGQPIGEEIVTFQQPSGPEARAYFTARHRTGTTGRFGTLEDAQRFIRMRNPPQGRPSAPPAPEPVFRQDPDPEPINITINVIDGDNRANPAARRLVQPDGSTGSIKSCPPRQAKPEKPKPRRPRSRPPAVKARTLSGGRSAGRNETPVAGHPLALIARVGRRKHGVK